MREGKGLFITKVAETSNNVIIEGFKVGNESLFTIMGVLELHTGELVQRPAE